MHATFPPYRISSELTPERYRNLERMLGITLTPEMTFSDITTDMLKPLLLRSLRTARQNKDEPFVNILLILLEHLDTIMATCPELDLNA